MLKSLKTKNQQLVERLSTQSQNQKIRKCTNKMMPPPRAQASKPTTPDQTPAIAPTESTSEEQNYTPETKNQDSGTLSILTEDEYYKNYFATKEYAIKDINPKSNINIDISMRNNRTDYPLFTDVNLTHMRLIVHISPVLGIFNIKDTNDLSKSNNLEELLRLSPSSIEIMLYSKKNNNTSIIMPLSKRFSDDLREIYTNHSLSNLIYNGSLQLRIKYDEPYKTISTATFFQLINGKDISLSPANYHEPYYKLLFKGDDIVNLLESINTLYKIKELLRD